MPKGLKTQGKLLKSELKREGRLDDLMHVAKKCRELVAEEQRVPQAQARLLIAAEDLQGYDIMAMAATTGMPLTHHRNITEDNHNPACAGVPTTRSGKWCDGCPHKGGGQCFCDPGWRGTLPCSIYLNKERLDGIKKARERNAADHGVKCEELTAPSSSKIEAYKKMAKKRKEQRASGKKKPNSDGKGAPGAAAAEMSELEEFMSGLMDITHAGMAVGHWGYLTREQARSPTMTTTMTTMTTMTRLPSGMCWYLRDTARQSYSA